MTADYWTPKEQRSRDRWRAQLVKIQYEEGLSTEELAKKLQFDPGNGTVVYRTSKEYEEALRQSIEMETTTENNAVTQIERPDSITTSAEYVWSYLFPQDTAKKRNKRKK